MKYTTKQRLLLDFLVQNGLCGFSERDDQAPSYCRCWTLFGGTVESDESPIEAVLRELREEIERDLFTVTEVTLFKEFDQRDIKQAIFLISTDAELDQLILREGVAMRSVKPADVDQLDFAFNIQQVLDDYRSAKHLPIQHAA